MEPPLSDGSPGLYRHRTPGGAHAATEPPLGGGNTILADNLYVYLPAPRWSPPSDGGSIRSWPISSWFITLPQWSPPLSGGSTLAVLVP
jgi:hypothetical protein